MLHEQFTCHLFYQRLDIVLSNNEHDMAFYCFNDFRLYITSLPMSTRNYPLADIVSVKTENN